VALILIGFVLQLPVLKDQPGRNDPDRHRQTLLVFHSHESSYLASSIVQAAAAVRVAGVLFYLYRAVRIRRPQLPGFVPGLLVLAPVLLLVAALLTYSQLHDLADKFTRSGALTDTRAKTLIDGQSRLGPGLGYGGTLALAFALVFLNLHAMRIGLLTRFLGIVGMIAGGLIVLPLLPSPLPVVEIFWLGAVGFVFLGRYRGGRGPAWEAGEAVPWPKAPRRTQASGRLAGGRRGEPPPEEPEAPAQAEQRPASRKRRRKKRR
jgi:hypothetical protein